MFQLDEKFLEDVGLIGMPENQKKPFLQHIYDELELRVGTRLSNGMTDAQLAEFESIIERNDEAIGEWLHRNVPNYAVDANFANLRQATGLDVEDPALRAEFAATKWLEINRPDYRSIVAQVLAELKSEIAANRDAILSSN